MAHPLEGLIHSLVCEYMGTATKQEQVEILANIICHCLEHIEDGSKIPWQLTVDPNNDSNFIPMMEVKIKKQESPEKVVAKIIDIISKSKDS